MASKEAEEFSNDVDNVFCCACHKDITKSFDAGRECERAALVEAMETRLKELRGWHDSMTTFGSFTEDGFNRAIDFIKQYGKEK